MSESVVVDTYVFIRSLTENGEYRPIYDAILERCDRIIVNTRIVDEYVEQAPKAGVQATLILGEVIPDLLRRGKWRTTANRRVDVGPEQDRPFIGAAIEARVRYIISTDRRAFRKQPVLAELQRRHIEALYPQQYLDL
ncbi:MAG: hypothetical protein HY685_02850 [Chloroflexi bacterium]|nr:hypothetical protein [Chloroflexota bacterium]